MDTLSSPQIQRSLAAIVITDAVGFSKLMSQDEDAALRIINSDLQIIKDLCVDFEGKILKTTGDGVLMYFISAVKAASCAVEIQKQFAAFMQEGAEGEHFTHRIGVHLGDIFFNQEDMMGTGVNIAARLESEAKPGAICMSQVVYEVVKYRLNLDVVYAGELSLKNIEQSVSAYHVWPPDIRPSKSPAQFGEAIFPLLTSLNASLKALSAHPENHRIKKLLYAVHTGFLQDSSEALESVSLKLLVESLTSKNESLTECKCSLSSVIKTLNFSERYAQIAQIILDNIKNVYVDTNDDLQIFSAKSADGSDLLETKMSTAQRDPTEVWKTLTQVIKNRQYPIEEHNPIVHVISSNLKNCYIENNDGTRANVESSSQLETLLNHQNRKFLELCKKVSTHLEASSNSIRIKQLLYFICCNQWENHTDRIQAVPMLSLIQDLYQQIDNPEALKKKLYNVLLRLKCKTTYAPIANEIFKESRLLYSHSHKPSSTSIYLCRVSSS